MYIYIFTVLEHTQDSYYANVPTGLELGLYHILIRYVVISVYSGHCLLHHRRRLPLRKTRRRNGFGVSESSTVPQSSHNSSLSRNLYTRVLRWLFIKSYKTVEEIYLYKPIFVAKASDLHIGLPPLVIKVYHIFSY